MFIACFAVLIGQATALIGDMDLKGFTGGTAGSSIIGAMSSQFGNTGGSAGDVNGDGFNDLVLTSRQSTDVLVVFSRAGGYSLDAATFTSGASNGFKITCSTAGLLSYASTAGDINGDGYDDIVIGAPFAAPFGVTQAGTAYLIFGHAGAFADINADSFTAGDSTGFRMYGTAVAERVGASVGPAGDVNGDGYDDFIVVATSADYSSAYVMFGHRWGFADISLSRLVSTGDSRGYRIQSTAAWSNMECANTAGDFNHDGYSDVLVGFPSRDRTNGVDTGLVFVIFGHSNATAFPTLDLSTFTSGATGFIIVGAAANDRLGFSASYAGDFNDDGVDDFMLGVPLASANGKASAGMAYVFFGDRHTTSFSTLELSAFTSVPKGFKILGGMAGDSLGSAVGFAGDLNGDGIDDVAVGASRADPLSRANAGTVYVIYGHSNITAFVDIDMATFTSGVLGFQILGGATGDALADRVVGYAGDVNADGIDDLYVGGPGAHPLGRDTDGMAYIIHGVAPPPTPAPTARPTIVPACSLSLCGNEPDVNEDLLSKIRASPTYKVHNRYGFAVTTVNGSVYTWGEGSTGGDSSSVRHLLTHDVLRVVSSQHSFAALKEDASVVAWGKTDAIREDGAEPLSDYSLLYLVANEGAYAGIDGPTGGVRAFGRKDLGGDLLDGSTCPRSCTRALHSGVISITASAGSFAAMRMYGTVFVWGNPHTGAGVSAAYRSDVTGARLVVATRTAFAVLLDTGGVVAWGGKQGGGDTSAVADHLMSGVLHIVASKSVFVAFKTDSSIVTWGYGPYGGDTSAVTAELSANVTFVAHTFSAFAALKSDGSVTTWGDAGGGGDSSAVQTQLVNIVKIFGNSRAFAAVSSAGKVVAWGKAAYGGQIPSNKVSALSSGVVSIYHTDRAFAALKADGSVVVWGQAGHGGSPGAAVEAHLVSGVHTICSNDVAFSAIKTDGSVVGWGHPVSIPTAGVLFTAEALTRAPVCA